ncbi:MAG: hypothetical protein AAGF56_04145 [Pseudomonadota bacterium]
MRWLFKWLKRLVVLLVLIAIGLVAPVGYNELACIPKEQPSDYASLLPSEHHRDESRTLMTYPEWHIVHAYDDYAQVITAGDPHDFKYLKAIGGFWSSLCALSHASAMHGGFSTESKQTIYVIGVSFTAELLLKAAYEETLGRLATQKRGDTRAALDDVSADQARAYAVFLQQTPWYKWDFNASNSELADGAGDSFRDNERRLALGLENMAKSAYADVIAEAVAQVGEDQLTLRMIVNGLTAETLETLAGVTLIGPVGDGFEIETPRYRKLTSLLDQMASLGAEFVEIAGNDDILFTAVSQSETAEGAIHSFARQGYGDSRHLVLVKVTDLANRLRDMQAASGPDRLRLEHVHDY